MGSAEVSTRSGTANRPHLEKLTYVLQVLDAASIAAALHLARGLSPVKAWNTNHPLALIIAVMIFSLVGGAKGLYRRRAGGRLGTELRIVWFAWGWWSRCSC